MFKALTDFYWFFENISSLAFFIPLIESATIEIKAQLDIQSKNKYGKKKYFWVQTKFLFIQILIRKNG